MLVDQRRGADLLAKKLGLNNDVGAARMRKRLAEMVAARPTLKQVNLDSFATITSVVEEAGKAVKKREFTGLEVWQASAALPTAIR